MEVNEMNIREKEDWRIENGDRPYYKTKRGKFLWMPNKYDAYSSAAKCDILVDAFGKFWGYSDNPKAIPLFEDKYC